MTYSIYSQSGLLNGVAVSLMFYHLVLLILERKMCRTNVSEKHTQFNENVVESDPTEANNKNEFGSRTSTVRLTKVKTRQIKFDEKTKEEFMGDNIERAKTKISSQQKMKYILHMVLLVVTHIFIFWFVPIYGNLKLDSTAACIEEDTSKCNNFRYNSDLRVFYLLYCLYFYYTCKQISMGFPLEVRPSSCVE
jgi:ABC-type multidrug transport system fused ATPase/permease subunit